MSNICILMSVYKNDDSRYLAEALSSVIINQTVKPAQVVLVVDGELPIELSNEVTVWDNKYPELDVIWLKENVGLSNAMNEGLKHCKHELVFRMDSDDVAASNRFSLQINAFNENPTASMIGGYYRQFDQEMGSEVGSRILPLCSKEIKSYANRRTPINHVAIGFKLKDILEVGGYPDTRLPFEDWWLAMRFINSKKEIINIPEYLVNVRSGESFYARRVGMLYLKQEAQAMLGMYKEGVIPLYFAVTNFIIRAPVRLAPNKLISLIYKYLLRSK